MVAGAFLGQLVELVIRRPDPEPRQHLKYPPSACMIVCSGMCVGSALFHENAHAAEWRFTSGAEWDRETDRLIRWRERGGALRISMSSAKIEEALRSAGYNSAYDPHFGGIVLRDARSEAEGISGAAVIDIPDGTQDSELVAESIRFVANHGFGKNVVADTIARCFLGDD